MELRNAYRMPYPAYDMQVELMDRIHEALAQGRKVGVFESPTGTVTQGGTRRGRR